MTKSFILPETAAVLEFINTQEGPHLAELPPSQAREIYHQLGSMFDESAECSVRAVDIGGTIVPLRAYFPSSATSGPVILYMHGGGWVIGDLETHHALCTLIARLSGLRVVAVDYRLAPETPYPGAHEDCLAAAHFVSGNPAELEAPVTGIAVAGDSAGGNLAFHISANLGSKGVLAQLLIYPWVNCASPDEGSYNEFGEGYLLDRRMLNRFVDDYLPGGQHVDASEVALLRHPLPSDLPPTITLAAGLDPLRDQSRALAGRIAEQGIESHYLEAAGLIHGLATMRKSLPSSNHFIERATAIFVEAIHASIARRGEVKA
ncbi:alpha/beta hydrolase [Xanthobacter autotrophicus]|uniref:alpha/beta hydrolase n=1 Tax=Xanthobacter autotrophicus TaxID=280 RepID=UPI003726445C